jgi:hypothetical protein
VTFGVGWRARASSPKIGTENEPGDTSKCRTPTERGASPHQEARGGPFSHPARSKAMRASPNAFALDGIQGLAPLASREHRAYLRASRLSPDTSLTPSETYTRSARASISASFSVMSIIKSSLKTGA